MGEIVSDMEYTSFNSPVELGTRASLILTVVDKRLSLDDLVLLDYALLYSESFGGPENLHPALPNHIAEIGHRREFLPEAVNYFVKRGLIDFLIKDEGHYYSSNSKTLNFVSCLKSAYYRKAWLRLDWIRENYFDIVSYSFPTYALEEK